MTYRTDRPLDNPINWSFRVGRVFGITVKVHIAFIIAALVMISMELPRDAVSAPISAARVVLYGLGTYVLLFAVVLLHEFGHCAGARYSGGDADEILIWPLGGLAFTQPANNPASHMITTLAGPCVNVVLCAITSFALVLWTGELGSVPWNPFHPFLPIDPLSIHSSGQEWLVRAFGVSYLLLLFNMLPVFPFDGGRVLQAYLWPRKGYRDSTLTATSIGMVGAIVVGVVGLFTHQSWLLLMVAVFGYFECWNTRRMLRDQAEVDGGEFGYDFSRGFESFEASQPSRTRKPGWIERWKARRSAEKARREREREEAHERAVEEVLSKISSSGLGSLTPVERRVLEEETRRRRERDADRA